MCLLAIAHNVHPDYRLIIAANRDEFYARRSAPAAFWEEHPQVLAGRDLEQGGTWLGVTRSGRLAALTNIRNPRAYKSNAPSRGALTREFLASELSAAEFVQRLRSSGAAYNGFNLVLWDGERLAHVNSQSGYYQEIHPGIHALSNLDLNTPWPKVEHAKQSMTQVLRAESLREPVFALLADRSTAADQELPDTGVGIEMERRLSPIFIHAPNYGTRCSTLVMIGHDGRIRFEERSFDAHAEMTHQFQETFFSTPVTTPI